MSVDNMGDVKPSKLLNRLRSTAFEHDMYDAVLCELITNKLPQQMQLSLVATLKRPLLQQYLRILQEPHGYSLNEVQRCMEPHEDL